MSIITISRGMFSGGLAVAVRLAERLGYPCVGRDELYRSVKRYGLADDVLQSIYSGPPDYTQAPGTRIAILNIYRAALLRYAQEGNLVYHGSVGHLLLTGIPNILRVRINTSMDRRIQMAMESREIPHDQAAALIQQDDEECKTSARNLYDVDWHDPLLYDIVLNLNHVDIDEAVDLLTRMSRFNNFNPSTTSQRDYEDLFLGCRVWAELVNNPQISGTDVMVAARDGHITVHGCVCSEAIAAVIRATAEKIDGVRSVSANLDIGTMRFG